MVLIYIFYLRPNNKKCPSILGFKYNNTISDDANREFNNFQTFLTTLQKSGCNATKIIKVEDESNTKSCSKILTEIKTNIVSSNIDNYHKAILIQILEDLINSSCKNNKMDANQIKSMIKSFCE